jgi:Protein of unknown function (DUF2510)
MPEGPTPVMTEAAGWFPFLAGAPGTLRYWDGTDWTDHFATPDYLAPSFMEHQTYPGGQRRETDRRRP